jgi:HPt (histidine-containing phosphotransfer) domain-containing protein
LKGVAATLGADRVSELAASIEQSIKQGQASSEISQSIAVLNQRLTDAMTFIANLLENEQTIGSSGSRQRVLEHLKTLQALLADDDITSVDVWNQVRPLLVQSAATDELKKIDKHMADFDFPAVLAWLNVVIEKMIDV